MYRLSFFVTLFAVFCFSATPSSSVRGNDWETLPVFSGGRIMPLHTFAQQTVTKSCGTSRPFLVRDNDVLNELTRVIELFRKQEREQNFTQTKDSRSAEQVSDDSYRFLIRGSDLDGGFGKEYSLFDVERETPPISSTLPIKGLTRIRAERLADRIRVLIPTGGRYFTADEMLLSWVSEPEVWMFIPLFPVTDTEFGEEVLELNLAADTRTQQHRVSLYQLTKSPRYQQRLADMLRRQQFGQITEVPILYDQIAERLETQTQLFRELTFHPRRSKPVRMIGLLEQAGGLTTEHTSYSSAFDAWRYLLTIGEVPMRQSTEPKDMKNENDALRTIHPTTQRWHEIADKIHLLVRVFKRTDSHGNMFPPNTDAVEQQFEQLIALIDKNLEESGTLMEMLYPGVSFRPLNKEISKDTSEAVMVETFLPLLQKEENRERDRSTMIRLIPSYHYSVKRLRYEVEAAYLALYDDGSALRILPVCSLLACGGIDEGHETFGVQPWGSFQMVTTAGEAFVKRFFDPKFQTPVTKPAVETDTDAIKAASAATAESKTKPKTAEGTKEAYAGKALGTDVKDELESAAESDDPLAAVNASIRALSTLDKKKEDAAANSTEASGEKPDGEMKDTSPMTEAEKQAKEAEKKLQEEMFAKPASDEELIFEETPLPQLNSIMNTIRTDVGLLLSTYSMKGVEYGDSQFALRASSLQSAIRGAWAKIEKPREQIADTENPLIADWLQKTAYPDSVKVRREYNYTRFAPFYWMFIFGAVSVGLSICAFFWGTVRRRMIVTSSYSIHSTIGGIMREEESRPDYTNTAEEFFNAAAVVMLCLSVLITFIGGAMRASITGWAPVTNMYETVVFTAFCAGLFGLWYSLYPLLQPVVQLGWQYAHFPSWKLVVKLFSGRKNTMQRGAGETEGEFAIRQAAAEFSMIHSGAPHNAGDEEHLDKVRQESIARCRLLWQTGLMPLRLILMFIVFYCTVTLCNGQDAAEYGLFTAAVNMLAVNDVIDMLVIVIICAAAVWYVPHFILMFFPAPFIFVQPHLVAAELGIVSYRTAGPEVSPAAHSAVKSRRSEFSGVFAGERDVTTAAAAVSRANNSGYAWLTTARNGILDRKLFTMIAAGVLVLAGLAAYLNTSEFNPEIRPIAAVLRSNFWLTVHVIAIVASYAAAFVAWGISVAALGNVVFGKFQKTLPEFPNDKIRVQLPAMSLQCSPIIEKLLKVSMLLLILGTVLGARWADYSWGRFWSWDPKEVWALITIMFYVIVLHGVIARWYGQIGVMVGALFASIAVIITWYGINFVFKGSIHSYGGGSADNAKLFLGLFIVANLLWGALAVLRYLAENYGSGTENGEPNKQ
ncbi:MAG: cytochrome c biogenesis protein CcsA [Planctomycetaceae bacterium]|jgi:ABC-type transport system involved in cytochrome c biogenesis permease subunit|nr:cytochrome c biogenesis protein CcsA [Planctomycetaceae bacterium]